MTAEQRDCYQNFINVLSQILIKYAAAENANKARDFADLPGEEPLIPLTTEPPTFGNPTPQPKNNPIEPQNKPLHPNAIF